MTSEYTEERHPFGKSDNLPHSPPPGVMWVFEENGQVVAVDFLCPCGCGSSCYTPMHQNHPRCWSYEKGPNGPTIRPSIRYTGGCKAHFTITDGKVQMHEDSGR